MTMQSANGGKRPGAGRPKGSAARRTENYLRSLRQKYPSWPLDFLMQVQHDQRVTLELRLYAAKSAAPYCHRKLAPLAVEEKPERRYSADLDKLDDDELVQFERLLMKSQVPVEDQVGDEEEEFPPAA
jgi:hypothetical protein